VVEQRGAINGFPGESGGAPVHGNQPHPKNQSENRERTVDLLALTQNVMLVSNYAELRWKAADIVIKLQDIYARLERVLGPEHELLTKVGAWFEKLQNTGATST